MRERTASLCRYTAVVLLMALATLCTLHQVGTNGHYHMALHRQLGADQATGLTMDAVERATWALANCLKTGDTGYLAYQDQVYGQPAQVFNDREIAHMEDVAALFALLRQVIWALSGAVLLVGLLGWALNKPTRAEQGRALVGGALIYALLAGALAAACALNFDRAFLAFHRLFFHNDLWILDPRTDLMIRLLPERFFMAVATRVALLSALWPAITLIIGALAIKMGRTNHERRR